MIIIWKERSCILNKQDYYHTINLQIEDLRTLVEVQTEKCFDAKKLEALMPEETVKGLKRVIITGCGDSFSAAGSMKLAFCEHSGLKMVSAPDPMEFCRFYEKGELLKGNKPEEVLVIAVSASGGSDRIVEILQKAGEFGTGSMLISNNPESKGAKAAKYMYHVETPDGCNSPGLRSYFASMIAIAALGAYIGLKHGYITQARFESVKANIVDYTRQVMEQYACIDEQIFSLCETWKEYGKFEVIGDGAQNASAQFVEEKFIECAGVYAAHADSEDWCHINFFLREPEKIGTIFLAPSGTPGFDRMLYSIRSAVGIGRPVLVVTDAKEEQFPEGIALCCIPKAPEPWMSPLVDFIPGSLMGGYVAALQNKLFFTGRYDYRTQTWKV